MNTRASPVPLGSALFKFFSQLLLFLENASWWLCMHAPVMVVAQNSIATRAPAVWLSIQCSVHPPSFSFPTYLHQQQQRETLAIPSRTSLDCKFIKKASRSSSNSLKRCIGRKKTNPTHKFVSLRNPDGMWLYTSAVCSLYSICISQKKCHTPIAATARLIRQHPPTL